MKINLNYAIQKNAWAFENFYYLKNVYKHLLNLKVFCFYLEMSSVCWKKLKQIFKQVFSFFVFIFYTFPHKFTLGIANSTIISRSWSKCWHSYSLLKICYKWFFSVLKTIQYILWYVFYKISYKLKKKLQGWTLQYTLVMCFLPFICTWLCDFVE